MINEWQTWRDSRRVAAGGSSDVQPMNDEFELRIRRLQNGVDNTGKCAAYRLAEAEKQGAERIRVRAFQDRLAWREENPPLGKGNYGGVA